ncbi:MAG: RluA family pseudouridine synthase [Lysobacterales bacterium]|jgi:23S rRNA pseudouridine955/2504/2580 synthase
MNSAVPTVSHVEVTRDRAGQRLDNFLAARMKGVPRSVVYRVIRTGQVRVNGSRAKPATRLQEGDVVRIPPAATRGSSAGKVPPKVLELLSGAILFEGHGVLVVDKPAGMAVHAGSGLSWGVVDALRALRPKAKIDLAHRLDRETSGCLLLATDGQALRDLHEQLLADQVDKRYLCLMHGRLKEDLVKVSEPIGRYLRGGERFMRVDPGGKPASTTFRLLETYGGYSFAEASLHTGRTHQIRVHAAHLGLSLAGDRRYSSAGRQQFWANKGLQRLFLHAHQLGFTTLDGEQQLVSSELPDDLRSILNNLP